MKLLKFLTPIIIALSLFSCSNTADLSQETVMNYHQSNFDKTVFKPVNKNTVKKSFSSDHYLMMSLLNRPMTTDQAMMLTFTQQAQNETAVLVNFVSLRGDKKQHIQQDKQTSKYTALIAKDINSVSISGSL